MHEAEIVEGLVPFYKRRHGLHTQENEAVDCCVGPLRHLSNVARHALFPLLSMPQNRKGLTNAAVADFSYATEEFVCGVDIMCGKMQGHVVLPLPTR